MSKIRQSMSKYCILESNNPHQNQSYKVLCHEHGNPCRFGIIKTKTIVYLLRDQKKGINQQTVKEFSSVLDEFQ